MGDMHQIVIDDDGVVVGGDAVALDDDEIADPVGIEFHIAPHHVVDDDLFVRRHAQADRRFASLGLILLPLLFGQIAAFPAVARHLAGFQLSLALRLQLFRSAVAVIRLALRQESVRVFLIDTEAFHLMVRPVRTAHIDAFVPGDPEPLQRGLDIFLGFRRGTFPVGILDPQYELAPHFPGKEPVEQGGPGAADMEWSSRARCKTYSHFFIHEYASQQYIDSLLYSKQAVPSPHGRKYPRKRKGPSLFPCFSLLSLS